MGNIQIFFLSSYLSPTPSAQQFSARNEHNIALSFVDRFKSIACQSKIFFVVMSPKLKSSRLTGHKTYKIRHAYAIKKYLTVNLGFPQNKIFMAKTS